VSAAPVRVEVVDSLGHRAIAHPTVDLTAPL
jgi:hypothetical protein